MSNNDLFAIILMAAILAGTGFFVSAPFLRRRPEDIFEEEFKETALHELLSRKDSIYMAMKDLEFDYTTGKLSDDDYNELREKFTVQATGVLREIDQLANGERKQPAKKKLAQVVCDACGFKIGPQDHFCQACGAKLA